MQENWDDKIGPRVRGHVLIKDKGTGEILVDKFNAIHAENFSLAIAQSLGNRGIGMIHEMVFGNGASTVSGTGVVTYFPPNVTGSTAQLYNQTYRKVVDDMSPLDVNTTDNNIRIQHTQNTIYSDIVISCTLEVSEPAGQYTFDNATNQSDFVFNELGLKGAATIEGTGNLLTHVVFHPVQKSLNRAIEVVYTVRIFMT